MGLHQALGRPRPLTERWSCTLGARVPTGASTGACGFGGVRGVLALLPTSRNFWLGAGLLLNCFGFWRRARCSLFLPFALQRCLGSAIMLRFCQKITCVNGWVISSCSVGFQGTFVGSCTTCSPPDFCT